MRSASITILAALAVSSALAQSSDGYRLEEQVFNAGGHPLNGSTLSSTSFRVRMDSLADPISQPGLASASYRADAGFLSAYPPPGEVGLLAFVDKSQLRWDAERSAGAYDVYRAPFGTLADGTYGDCLQHGVPTTSTSDTGTPPPGVGWFYLVTVENRVGEEGTKGRDTDGREREGTVCP